MTDNTMRTLRCAVGHGDMVQLFGRPAGGMFSVWLCEGCGDLALHMEARGDIYWFKTAVIDRMGRRELWKGEPAFPTADPGERAHDNAQAEAAQAEWDTMPEEDQPMRRDDLPW